MEGNAVVQSDVISTMIQTTISAQEAQRQDRAAKLAEYRKAMEVALHQELGEDLWTLLFPYMHADFHNEGRDSYVLYVFVYDAIPLQLAPLFLLNQEQQRVELDLSGPRLHRDGLSREERAVLPSVPIGRSAGRMPQAVSRMEP